MDTSTPPASTPSPKTAFAFQAAKASWVSAVVVFFLITIGGRTGGKALIELLALLLIFVGLVLGVIALFGVRRHGTKGILAHSLAGILINGLLIFIFVTNFLAARARARKAAAISATPVVVTSTMTCERLGRYES